MILSSAPEGPEGRELTLNGAVLPGIVRDVKVSGKMQAERNARTDGGRDFVLKGWEPAEISVEVALLDGGKTDSDGLLEQLVGWFKKTENGEAVQYDLIFPQTKAWGIGRCYFIGLDSSQNTKQMYGVNLKFVEFRPEIDAVKRQQEEKKAAKDPNAPAGPAPQKSSISDAEQRRMDELMAEKNLIR
ncbi:MAG: hypothetical protein AAF975_00105 [Spirochaetota bacterium]